MDKLEFKQKRKFLLVSGAYIKGLCSANDIDQVLNNNNLPSLFTYEDIQNMSFWQILTLHKKLSIDLFRLNTKSFRYDFYQKINRQYKNLYIMMHKNTNHSNIIFLTVFSDLAFNIAKLNKDQMALVTPNTCYTPKNMLDDLNILKNILFKDVSMLSQNACSSCAQRINRTEKFLAEQL